jgi:sec-independent protein translocase protein TatA
MGGLSIWHLLLVGVVVMVLFGKGRVSDLMEDVGKGIKSFKKGIADDEPASLKTVTHVDGQPVPPAAQPVTPPPITSPTENN